MNAVPDVEQRTVVSGDGTRIAYQALGRGKDVLLLANGLGGRLYAWGPLIEHYRDRYRILCWDYRGLFDSESPKSHRELAMHRHVEDAIAILRQEEERRAVLVGWSMGVQVSLDVAVTHPELVAGLVLLNGTHGHALRTAFQPLVGVPGLDRLVHRVIAALLTKPLPLHRVRALMRRLETVYLASFVPSAGLRAFTLRPVLRQYMSDVLGESFPNYLRLFQELDAHSVFHVLPDVHAPALVISGALDPMTPMRQSFTIARRLPNAEHLPLVRASHFALLERPEAVLPAIDRFLAERVRY